MLAFLGGFNYDLNRYGNKQSDYKGFLPPNPFSPFDPSDIQDILAEHPYINPNPLFDPPSYGPSYGFGNSKPFLPGYGAPQGRPSFGYNFEQGPGSSRVIYSN
jgi:hypothetical protein